MNRQISENPYEVASDQDVEVATAKGGSPVVRAVGLAIVAPLVIIFILAFVGNFESNRFSSSDVSNVVTCTGVCIVIASVLLPCVWAVAGLMVRRKHKVTLTQQESVLFVFKWIGGIVLLFATIPCLIEAFGTTYPISELTVSYFLLLALTMIFVMVKGFVEYRRAPSQKSAFVCCLGGMVVIMAVGMVLLFMYAVAASALT